MLGYDLFAGDTLNSISEQIEGGDKAENIEKARRNFTEALASGIEPAKASERLGRARDLGITPEDYDVEAPSVKFKNEADAIDWGLAYYNAPHTLELLQNENTVNTVKGDVTSLMSLEGLKQFLSWKAGGDVEAFSQDAGLGNAWARGLTNGAVQSPAGPAATLRSAQGELGDIERRKALIASGVPASEVFPESEDPDAALDLFQKTVAYRERYLNEVLKEQSELLALHTHHLNMLAQSEGAKAFANAEGLGDVLGVLVDNPSMIAEQGVESLMGQAPTLALMPFLGPLSGGALMGLSSYSLDMNSQYIEAIGAKVNLADPEATKAFLTDPKNQDLLDKLAADARAHAAPVGALDALSVGLAKPLTKILSKMMPSSGIGAGVARKTVEIQAQGALGATGEALGQLSAQGKITSVRDIVAEYVGEHFTGPIEIMGAVREAHKEMALTQQVAQRNTQVLASIGAQVSNMENPDPMVLTHVFDHGDDEQTLHLDADALKQSSPELYDALSAVPALHDRFLAAEGDGAPVDMTLGEYAAYAAPLDKGTGDVAVHVGVGDVLAQSALGGEQEAAQKAAADLTSEELKAMAKQERAEHAAELKDIRGDIEAQLAKVEGVTTEEGKAVAVLWSSLVDTLANDLNMSAKDVWASGRIQFTNGKPEEMGDARGLYSDSLRTIFKKPIPDRSTLLHETGHAYLEMRMRAVDGLFEKEANGEELTEQERYLVDTSRDILNWLGFDRDGWKAASIDEKRAAHEKFAESFEEYLRNGEAPVKGLQRVFDKFKAWLKQIYMGLSIGPNAQWSPEVQQLFNGIFLSSQLAKEFRVKNAEFFEGLKMTRNTSSEAVAAHIAAVDDEARILKGVEERIQSAYEKLARRLRRRKTRSMAAIRKKAAAQYRGSRAYRAIQALRGQVKGVKVTPTKALLLSLGYGEKQVQRLIDARIARVNESLNTVNDPQTLNAYAASLGYDAPDGNHAVAMFDEVFANLNYREAVNRLAEQAWNANEKEREIESLLRGFSVEEAVFNSDLVESTKSVLMAFERLKGAVNDTSGESIAVAAKAWVDVTPLKDQNLKTIAKNARANARRARQAFMEGRVPDAIAAQKKALYYMKVGEAVLAARKDARKVAKVIRRLKKSDIAKVGGRYTDLIHRVLVAVGIGDLRRYHLNLSEDPISEHLKEFGLLFSPKFLSRLDALEAVNLYQTKTPAPEATERSQAYLDENLVKHEDGSPLTPEEEAKNAQVQAEAEELPYDDEELALQIDTPAGVRDLGELLLGLEAQGRDALKMRKGEEAVETAKAQAAIIEDMERLNAQKGRTVQEEHEDNAFSSRVVGGLKSLWTQHLRVGTLFGRMVAKGSRAMYDYVLYPTDACNSAEETAHAAYTERLSKAMAPVESILRDHTTKPAVEENTNAEGERVFTRGETFVLLLNMGNEGNLIRAAATYLNRMHMEVTPENIEVAKRAMAVLVGKTLTKTQIRAAQSVWSVFDSVQKETKEVTARMDHKEPEWVEKQPLKIVVGDELVELSGGYYPIRYDRKASVQNVQHDINDIMEGVSVFAKNGICEGHLKSRIGAVPTDMYLTLTERALYEGLDAQIHYNTWAEHLKRMTSLFDPNGPLAQEIKAYWGKEATDYINRWMTDIANGNRQEEEFGAGIARFLRQGVSVAGIGFNWMTAIVQPIGYIQTVQHLGGKYALRGLGEFAKMGFVGAYDHVRRMSPMMENRAKTQMRELREIHARCESAVSSARLKMMNLAYLPGAMTQMVVDVPTWLGAYEKALAEGLPQDKAVAYADRAVIETQGSGRPSDLSQIERGGPWEKLFTVFYTFFNTTLNLLALSGYRNNKSVFLRDLLLLSVTQPVIESFLREAVKDLSGDGDDEKKEWWERASDPWHMASTVANFNLGLFVGLREFSDIIGGRDYKGPGGTRFISDVYSLGKQSKKISEGDIDPAVVNAMLRAVGSGLGLPVTPITRAVSGYDAIHNKHSTENPLVYIFGATRPEK